MPSFSSSSSGPSAESDHPSHPPPHPDDDPELVPPLPPHPHPPLHPDDHPELVPPLPPHPRPPSSSSVAELALFSPSLGQSGDEPQQDGAVAGRDGEEEREEKREEDDQLIYSSRTEETKKRKGRRRKMDNKDEADDRSGSGTGSGTGRWNRKGKRKKGEQQQQFRAASYRDMVRWYQGMGKEYDRIWDKYNLGTRTSGQETVILSRNMVRQRGHGYGEYCSRYGKNPRVTLLRIR